MKTYKINVHSHKTGAVVATITTQAWADVTAKHDAIRAVLAQGHTWDQHGGFFARVAP